MRSEYDFTNSTENPYTKSLKKQISIKIETQTIEYFKELAKSVDMPYQKLINSYLSECATKKIKPTVKWM